MNDQHDAPTRSHFTTAAAPPGQEFNRWRDSIGTLFDVSNPCDGEGFHAQLTSYLLNEQIMLSHCRSSAQHFQRGALRCARDGLDYYLIQAQLEGRQLVRRGSAEQQCNSGDLMVIDLADEHNAITDDFSNLTLVVPRPLLAPLLLEPDSQEGRVLRADQPLAALAVNHLGMLARLAPELSSRDCQQIIEPTLQLMASALNGSTDSVDGGVQGLTVSLLTRAKLEIEQSLHRPLSVAALCAALKISRATLYRLFEPYQGVRAYIQERRLRRCAQALLSPTQTKRHIYEIAFHWGFTSEAHFSRAFRNKFGLSPSEARQLGLAGAVPAVRENPGVGDRRYEYWLAQSLRS